MDDQGPQIRVEQVGRCASVESGRWLAEWRVENLTADMIELLAARAPHGKYRSRENEFQPRVKISGSQSARIQLAVSCEEAPGVDIENAFLILLVEWLNARWRIFVRFVVTVDDAGRPATKTELITTQRVGFSGVSD